MTADLKFPIGKRNCKPTLSQAERAEHAQIIADLPSKLRKALEGMTTEQLDTPYRPEGWTVRQLVHHIADSHMNAMCRFKRPLTEENPTLRTYDQDGWAELEDGKNGPLAPSLLIIEGVHQKLNTLLKSLAESDYERIFTHPDWGEHGYDYVLQTYSWHSLHHVAQITGLREREGW